MGKSRKNPKRSLAKRSLAKHKKRNHSVRKNRRSKRRTKRGSGFASWLRKGRRAAQAISYARPDNVGLQAHDMFTRSRRLPSARERAKALHRGDDAQQNLLNKYMNKEKSGLDKMSNPAKRALVNCQVKEKLANEEVAEYEQKLEAAQKIVSDLAGCDSFEEKLQTAEADQISRTSARRRVAASDMAFNDSNPENLPVSKRQLRKEKAGASIVPAGDGRHYSSMSPDRARASTISRYSPPSAGPREYAPPLVTPSPPGTSPLAASPVLPVVMVPVERPVVAGESREAGHLAATTSQQRLASLDLANPIEDYTDPAQYTAPLLARGGSTGGRKSRRRKSRKVNRRRRHKSMKRKNRRTRRLRGGTGRLRKAARKLSRRFRRGSPKRRSPKSSSTSLEKKFQQMQRANHLAGPYGNLYNPLYNPLVR